MWVAIYRSPGKNCTKTEPSGDHAGMSVDAPARAGQRWTGSDSGTERRVQGIAFPMKG